MVDVYLDLDGTLTDPYEGISKSILYALDRLGEAPVDEIRLRQTIGPPLFETFAALVGAESAAAALAYYRERFGDVGWKENVPYPGIPEALEELADNGFRLFVATSKPTVFAERICAHFGLAPYFTRIFGSELDGTRTDKAELLAHAMAANSSTMAIMVGDRKHDAIGALHNKIPFIGVLYGYGSKQELQSEGAATYVTTPSELPGCVLRLTRQ